jgi:translation initiation factor 1A
MPKKKGLGGKKKKRGKRLEDAAKRPIDYKSDNPEDLQLYGMVEKILGGQLFQVLCEDGKMRTCHIRGKFRKRCWVKSGSVVVVGLRMNECSESEKVGKCDLLHKYNDDEVRYLFKKKIIPKSLMKDDVSSLSKKEDCANNDGLVFGEESENDSEENTKKTEVAAQPYVPNLPSSEDSIEDFEKELDNL